MSVNRYDPEDWGGLRMVPKPYGDWVCYEAWEHVNRQLAVLKEENERLLARVAELEEELDGWVKSYDEVNARCIALSERYE